MRVTVVVLLPFIALAVNVLVQVLVLRASGGAGFRRSLLVGFAAGAAAIAIVLCLPGFATGDRDPGRGGTALLAYGAYLGFGFGYFAFLNLNQASLRVRIMKELLVREAPLTLEELLMRYSAGQILDARLSRLLAGGQIRRQGEVFVSGPRADFLSLARLLDLLKFVVTGRKACS